MTVEGITKSLRMAAVATVFFLGKRVKRVPEPEPTPEPTQEPDGDALVS